MAITISAKSNFVNNPMNDGINPAVITDLAERQIVDFNDKSKLLTKVVARFVNAEGQEASRFYTPSLNEKSTLRKDLLALGILKAGEPVQDIPDLEALLVGRQCVVVISEGVSAAGQPTAKITAVSKAMKGQSVPMPAGKTAAAAPPATKATTRKAAPKAEPVIEDGAEIGDDDIPF